MVVLSSSLRGPLSVRQNAGPRHALPGWPTGLADKLGLAIVIVGSESERLIGEKVRDEMRNPATVLSGKTTLENPGWIADPGVAHDHQRLGAHAHSGGPGHPDGCCFRVDRRRSHLSTGSSSASGSTSGPVQSVPVARVPDRSPMHGSGNRGRCFRNCNVAGDNHRRALESYEGRSKQRPRRGFSGPGWNRI